MRKEGKKNVNEGRKEVKEEMCGRQGRGIWQDRIEEMWEFELKCETE